MCLKEVLSWLKDQAFNRVEIESDAKGVVDSFRCRNMDESELGIIIEACSRLVPSCPNLRVCYIRHTANVVAGIIAKEACQWPHAMYLLLVPEFVRIVANNNVANFES
ncbi:hypothetical protein M5689_004612 [Euphorbia peplus]|nr:hypothetical protein M5689_004612 [Euphorbia peplus]